MPPRRNRIPNEVRRRIVRAFEDPTKDYLSVADTLGVNRSTARSIVATFLREGRVKERPRGGRNNVRVDNEMRDWEGFIEISYFFHDFSDVSNKEKRRPGIHIYNFQTLRLHCTNVGVHF